MDHVWDHLTELAIAGAIAAITIVGCMTALVVLMRRTYAEIVKDQGLQITAVIQQNLSQQGQINSLVTGRQTDQDLSLKLRKRDRIVSKKRERACRKELAQVKEEQAVMRRQCPILSGETNCTFAECPVSLASKIEKPKDT